MGIPLGSSVDVTVTSAGNAHFATTVYGDDTNGEGAVLPYSNTPAQRASLALTGLDVGSIYVVAWQAEMRVVAGTATAGGVADMAVYLSTNADDYATDLAANDLANQTRIGRSRAMRYSNNQAYSDTRSGMYKFTAVAATQAISLLGCAPDGHPGIKLRNFRADIHLV